METPRVERRLSAIMVADVVGYSHLIEVDEAATIAAVRALRAEMIEPLVADPQRPHRQVDGRRRAGRVRLGRRRGRLRRRDPEGAGRSRRRTPRPRACSCSASASISATSSSTATMCSATPSTSPRGWSRSAQPGGVLISGTAYDHMQGKLGLPLDFVGEEQVKNIERPVQELCRPARRVARDAATRRTRAAAMARSRSRRRLIVAAVGAGAGAYYFWPQPSAPVGGDDEAVDRGASVRQPRRRRGERAPRRGADRRHHHRPHPLSRLRHHRAELARGLPQQADRCAPDRRRAQRPLSAGGLDPARGRAHPRHRAADRRGKRHATSGRSAGTGRPRISSRCRARWPSIRRARSPAPICCLPTCRPPRGASCRRICRPTT